MLPSRSASVTRSWSPSTVQVAGLARVVAALRAMENMRGGVVTMPHKAAIVDLLDEVTPEGRQFGACNIIRREPDGPLIGAMLGEARRSAPPPGRCPRARYDRRRGRHPPRDDALPGRSPRHGCTLHNGKPMLAAQIDLMIAFMRA
jgi:hypothetical protein